MNWRVSGKVWRGLSALTLAVIMVLSLAALGAPGIGGVRQERLYFPSGKFLVESALGFREAAADYLWFRFIQYFGSYAKGRNDLRYLDLLVDGITRLDPKFVEAYHFASLVYWSELGDFPTSLDILKRGILHNPDVAKLPFQIGFTYYVFYQDYPRAAMWFEAAAACSDGTDRERRFAAFANHRAGDDRVSLELWKTLYNSTENGQMRQLALKMITKLERKLKILEMYGEGFIGPIPEI